MTDREILRRALDGGEERGDGSSFRVLRAECKRLRAALVAARYGLRNGTTYGERYEAWEGAGKALEGGRGYMNNCPIVMLDLDGVLNGHGYDPVAESSTIDPRCVREFNRILAAVPDAMIVLSSAWRYMVDPEAMTLRGFEYLLRTHGVHCKNRLLDVTCRDEEIELRGQQIRHWLNENGDYRRYVVLDDGGEDSAGEWTDMGIEAAGHPVVWCEGKTGLTADDAERAIRILKGDIE